MVTVNDNLSVYLEPELEKTLLFILNSRAQSNLFPSYGGYSFFIRMMAPIAKRGVISQKFEVVFWSVDYGTDPLGQLRWVKANNSIEIVEPAFWPRKKEPDLHLAMLRLILDDEKLA